MFIVPLTGLSGIAPSETAAKAPEAAPADGGVTIPFADVFKSVLDNAVETTAQAQQDSIDVMLGNIDDLHTVTINAQKAEVAVELLSTIRSRALEAYSEIMRMNI